ncbi:mitogen-activated protein kinase, putative [Phytophthora infestans T30-4]|uniref:Mitogen-activated protein kinase n=1 Tax=Phytophthora infestans (strain T30-4) TaxID=403677 RepID=D0NVW4_PHYIT|nr:mitogen-activated protein kinase, putative [Phytophthora infestans T30-4]EEY66795.1 mitogen-activated protein kinase, putative [Phytophthora infestans T30-4]|eukprot:XP_002896860.1 mitogen-activated protein kinase, putative [Phytophthora infestans T30-4]
MARQLSSRSPLSAPSSLSDRLQRASSTPVSSEPGSNSTSSSNSSGIRSQTLLARLFRRKERSPTAPRPLAGRSLYGEEEETKARVDSSMRALLRSLSLQRNRHKAEELRGPPSQPVQVLVEGVLTVLIQQRYWRSTPCYFVLEQTLESDVGTSARFTLRQFRYQPESRRPGHLVAIITLSQNDVVTDMRSYRQVKHALELQLSSPDQRSEVATEEREEESGAQVLRLAAADERMHVKWLQMLNSCIAKLITQVETQSRLGDTAGWDAVTEPAKIVPMFGDEGRRSSILLTRDREPNGSGVSYTSSECSNNHAEAEIPAEEIRAARQDLLFEDEDEVKLAVQDVQITARVAPASTSEELLTPTASGYCCSPDFRSNASSNSQDPDTDNNNATNEKESNNQEDNQGEDDSEEDSIAGDLATQSSVAPYKSAVLAGRGVSTYESDEYTKASSRASAAAVNGPRPLPRAAFGATSSSSGLFPMMRPQTHSFNANGQVFTLDTRYQLVKPIGNGAYGAVIAVKDVVNGGDNLAVKKITNIFEDLVDAKRILREVRLLGHFHHKNITRLHDLSPPPSRKQFDDMYIITELMETDLHQVIYSMQPMSDDHVKYFLYQMLCALHHIHSAGVLHRDMKPSNILLNANCDLKVCDFGLARGGVGSSSGLQQELQQLGELTEYVVTRWYRAPEIMLNCLHYTTAIDVWAVGCIFAEMLLREPLFPGNDYLHQLKLIIKFLGTPKQEDIGFVKNTKALRFLTKLAISKPKKWRDVFATSGAENSVSAEAIDLLSKMLLFNPDKRISVDAALRHPYLATFFDENDLVSSKPFDFSFDLPDDQLSKDALINLLCEDIEHFHPPVPLSVTPMPLSTAASRFFRMGMTASAS